MLYDSRASTLNTTAASPVNPTISAFLTDELPFELSVGLGPVLELEVLDGPALVALAPVDGALVEPPTPAVAVTLVLDGQPMLSSALAYASRMLSGDLLSKYALFNFSAPAVTATGTEWPMT